MSAVVIGWVWLKLANGVASRDDDFAKGLKAAAQYWLRTEVSRVPALATLCESAERSYLELKDSWL